MTDSIHDPLHRMQIMGQLARIQYAHRHKDEDMSYVGTIRIKGDDIAYFDECVEYVEELLQLKADRSRTDGRCDVLRKIENGTMDVPYRRIPMITVFPWLVAAGVAFGFALFVVVGR